MQQARVIDRVYLRRGLSSGDIFSKAETALQDVSAKELRLYWNIQSRVIESVLAGHDKPPISE